MKKLVILLCLAMFMAPSAFAVLDVDPDSMGMYWDINADTVIVPTVSGVSLLYITLTNPTFDALYGFECGFDIEAAAPPYILGATFANPQALDVAPGFQNFIVGFGAPTTCTQATLLVTLEIGNFAGVDLCFYMHAADPPSIEGILPVVLKANDVLEAVRISAMAGSPTAGMGYTCDVNPVENASWGSVKSMYR